MAKVIVPPESIEKELIRIWRGAVEEDLEVSEGEASSPRVRATLANAIFVGTQADVVQEKVDSLITELCIAHPSRFFIVGVGEETKDGNVIQSSVSSRCVQARSGTHICSEEIYLETRGEKGTRVVPNLILSLLVADVDVFIFVLGEIAENSHLLPLLQGLSPHSHHLVYDSGQFLDLSRSMSVLKKVVPEEGILPPLQCKDLSWIRTRRWRELIGEQFNASIYQDAEDYIDSVEMEVFLGEDSFCLSRIPGAARLLSGWLAYRLRWSPEKCARLSDGGLEFLCKSKEGEKCFIRFLLQKAQKKEERKLTKVSFFLNLQNGPRKVSIEREEGEARVQVCSQAQCDTIRSVPLVNESLSELVLSSILSAQIENDYKHALACAQKLSNLSV